MGKKKTSSRPKVFAFHREPTNHYRCSICTNEEMNSWLNGCLVETKKSLAPRPTGARIHREIKIAFPESHPRSENTTRLHLKEHESEWMNWSDED